jgi:hypothetical protein
MINISEGYFVQEIVCCIVSVVLFLKKPALKWYYLKRESLFESSVQEKLTNNFLYL